MRSQARSVGPADVVSERVSQSDCGTSVATRAMRDETLIVAERSPQSRSAIHSKDRGVTLGSMPMTARERAAAIRKAVRTIKRGTVASYGEVALRAGLPGRARLVGQVLRESGGVASLPWHRVTGAGGRIAFPAGSAPARE